eukprot:5059443-Lingulodinium_polyedra.AAC.1
MSGRAHVAYQAVRLPVACRGPLCDAGSKVTNGSEQIETSQYRHPQNFMIMQAALECNRPRGASSSAEADPA